MRLIICLIGIILLEMSISQEMVQLLNGNKVITGKGCGTLSPLKFLHEIPMNFEDHECTLILKKMELGFINHGPACPLPKWVGDGFCDDFLNVPHCDYDAGDCCIEPVNTSYCTECQCIQH